MIERGCLSILGHVCYTSVATLLHMNSIYIVHEFTGVFLMDLLGMPPYRDIYYDFNVEPRTKPISTPPHWKAPTELKEKC